MAEKVMNIYETISAVMADVGAIGKNSKNPQQGFMYRGIDAVMNALNPAMVKYHLFVVPEVLEQTREERTTSKGGLLIYSICKIKFTFYAQDGSSVTAVVIGEGMDSGDKSSNKAMSVGYKYACFQVFCIPTEEMKDPDAESHTPEPKTLNPKRAEQQAIAESKIGEAKINVLLKKCEDDGVSPMTICGKLNISELAEVTEKQFVWLKQNWSKEIVGK